MPGGRYGPGQDRRRPRCRSIGHWSALVVVAPASGRVPVAPTGTPLKNHLGELCSLFAALFLEMLGSWGPDAVEPMDEFEARLAARVRLAEHERYACCARITGDVTVTTSYW